MDPCAINVSASALVCAIAEGKTSQEINLLSAFFVQLGDSLATIQAARECSESEISADSENAQI